LHSLAQKKLARMRRRRERERSVAPSLRRRSLFEFDACLRFGGVGERHEAIEKTTGLAPTRSHRKGQLRGKSNKVYAEDLWLLASPLGRVSLDEHLEWLWGAVSPHTPFFKQLAAEAAWADVCLGCLSESAFPVLSVKADSLALTKELGVGLAFNFTCF
jgi:hypothetical protein